MLSARKISQTAMRLCSPDDCFSIDENFNRVNSFGGELFANIIASDIISYNSDVTEYICRANVFYGNKDNYVVVKIAPELYDNLQR